MCHRYAASLLSLCATVFAASAPAQKATLLKDIHKTASSKPSSIVTVFDRLFFFADDGTHGSELWTSDGTATGTRLVKDIVPGPLAPFAVELARLGDRVFFVTSRYSSTRFVWDVDLWVSDASAQGTHVVKRIGSTRSGGIPAPGFYSWRGKLYFQADDGVRGTELWVTDGSSAGTRLLADIRPQPPGSYPSSFAPLGDLLVFSAIGSKGSELYATDGTITRLLVDVVPGSGSSNPRDLTAWDGRLFFSARTTLTGRELFVSDGTITGTTLLKDIRPGSTGSDPEQFADFGDTLVFRADDGATGQELWTTDGSSANTKRLVDYHKGAASSAPGSTTAFGSRRLFFAADDGSGKGSELTILDAKGARLFQDLHSGPGSSSPGNSAWIRDQPFAYLAGKLYFAASDAKNGRELWVLDPAAAATQRVGPSCGLRVVASDAVLGIKDGVKITAAGFRKNHVGLLVLGTPPSRSLSAGTCEIAFDLFRPYFLLQSFLTGSGQPYRIALTMPASTAWTGLRFALQVVELDLGPQGPNWRATRGLELFLHPR